MTSFVAVNPNEPHDSSAYDQLLFLEKLKYSNPGCVMESSFVQSEEFYSILKQFKREKQKVEDEKKWEVYLEKRKQEEISLKKIEMHQPIITSPDVLDYNGYNYQNLNNHAYCEFAEEQPNIWLNVPHLQMYANFHKNEVENKCNSYNLNDSSLMSFKLIENDLHIKHTNDECCLGMQLCQNDEAPVMEIHGNDISNLNEQKNCDKCGITEGIYIEQLKQQSCVSEKICESSCELSTAVTENSSSEIDTNVSNVKLPIESDVDQPQKKQVTPSTSKGIVETNTNNQKKENKAVKNEKSKNTKNSYINEPEENYCKNVAKKIQDIPGVDNELRKVEDIRIKMTPILSNIKITIAKNLNSPISSDEDFERIKQRTLEFGARFKRNYLYRTNCQVNKLKEMLPNTLLVSKKSKILQVIQQLTAVHHAMIQALQVIEKQLQTISIFGTTQELIRSFYNCIYELTLNLKPFYGYLKAQILDEVEKHLIDTIELLKDLKLEDNFTITNKTTKQKKNQSKSSKDAPPWMKKSAALARLKFGPPMRVRKRKSLQEQNNKLLEPKLSKHSLLCDQGDSKGEQGMDAAKNYNFMMMVKQRPGAELRRANFDPIKTEEPKTMMELISREGSLIDNILKDVLPDISCTEYNKNLPNTKRTIDKDEIEKVKPLGLPEKVEPKNIKLVCIKREDLPEDIPALENKLNPNQDENIVQFEDLQKYRRAFKKYKKSNPLYEKNTLSTVVSMSEIFLEETITSVSQEINKMKISDLLGIVEEVEIFDEDSSVFI